MASRNRRKHRHGDSQASPATTGFLGLDRVVPRLIAEDGFEDREAALRSIAEYERFFWLATHHRPEALVPSFRVDLVWRRHMLDTRAYAGDCARWGRGYIHRDDGVPPGGFERCISLLGTADPAVWDRPGPAFVLADREIPAGRDGPGGALDREDLSGVLAKVRSAIQSVPSPPPWVMEARELLESDAMLAVQEYRRFLSLLVGRAGPITPCKLVDEFWHQHILDSRNYARFCSRTAGRYLHHVPHYEKPHGFHTPAFRRTLQIDKQRLGVDPPGRIWAHMGESGGGDGGSGDGGSLPPLYIVDTPDRMRAELTLGKVDRRHYGALHPVLAEKGLTKELWRGFLRTIDAAPRITWPEFAASKENSPKLWSIAVLCAGLLLAGLCAIHYFWVAQGPPAPESSLYVGTSVVMFFLTICVGAVGYALKWSERAFDWEGVHRSMARVMPILLKHGVTIVVIDGVPTVQVEASLTDHEKSRRQKAVAERRRQQVVEAERRRRFWLRSAAVGAPLGVACVPFRVAAMLSHGEARWGIDLLSVSAALVAAYALAGALYGLICGMILHGLWRAGKALVGAIPRGIGRTRRHGKPGEVPWAPPDDRGRPATTWDRELDG